MAGSLRWPGPALGAVRCPAAAWSCPAQARSPHSHTSSAQAAGRTQRRAPAGDWSDLMLYELAGHCSPDNGNCKIEGEMLLLSNSHPDCHRWVDAAAAVAAVGSLVGSDLSSYRKIHQ